MVSSIKQYYLRQITIAPELYQCIKKYCKDQKISMSSFYQAMIAWFLGQQRTADDVYQASYKKGHPLSMWIEEDLINQIKQMANKSRVSDARIIYTALVTYSQKYLNNL